MSWDVFSVAAFCGCVAASLRFLCEPTASRCFVAFTLSLQGPPFPGPSPLQLSRILRVSFFQDTLIL